MNTCTHTGALYCGLKVVKVVLELHANSSSPRCHGVSVNLLSVVLREPKSSENGSSAAAVSAQSDTVSLNHVCCSAERKEFYLGQKRAFCFTAVHTQLRSGVVSLCMEVWRKKSRSVQHGKSLTEKIS